MKQGFYRTATIRIGMVYGRKQDLSDWRQIVRTCTMTNEPLEIENFEFDTDNFLYFRAKAIKGDEPNGNGDYFPWGEVHAAFRTFCGKGFYIEHQSDDVELAKGIILDAVEHPKDKYVECLVAISKKDEPELCKQIQSGEVSQVSMGCVCRKAECSECGNVAYNEEDLCDHMNPNNPFTYIKGKIIKGEMVYEKNFDLTFTELSGVKDPAWEKADIFNIKSHLTQKLMEHFAAYRKAVGGVETMDKNELEAYVEKIITDRLNAIQAAEEKPEENIRPDKPEDKEIKPVKPEEKLPGQPGKPAEPEVDIEPEKEEKLTEENIPEEFKQLRKMIAEKSLEQLKDLGLEEDPKNISKNIADSVINELLGIEPTEPEQIEKEIEKEEVEDIKETVEDELPEGAEIDLSLKGSKKEEIKKQVKQAAEKEIEAKKKHEKKLEPRAKKSWVKQEQKKEASEKSSSWLKQPEKE